MTGLLAAAALPDIPSAGLSGESSRTTDTTAAKNRVRIWKLQYRAHNGKRRDAYVVLPAWYGPRRNPPIPVVISPHGRGVTGRANARLWGNLPARGGFAVVNPDGQGRRLPRHSWGNYGQIEDLARMPEILRKQLPWLRIDADRVYAFGGSMGGQESLLLLARYPERLAGVAVFDPVTDFALQYRRFPLVGCNRRCLKTWKGPVGYSLRRLAREEIGGSPKTAPTSYAMRSPMTYARSIAASCVPLQLWWSVSDRVVTAQQQQTGKLFWKLRGLNRDAPLLGYVGFWIHSSAMRARTALPSALATFGLLADVSGALPVGARAIRPLAPRAECGVKTEPLLPPAGEPPQITLPETEAPSPAPPMESE
jgi:pimeloyl-ACP methyl ester carboxylesterase